MRAKDRVAIGWIDGGQVDGLFAVSMLNLFTARTSRISTVIRAGGAMLAKQRNEVVASFLTTDAEWLFFIDSDETIDLAAFDILIDAAHDKDRPVVSGIVFAAWETGDTYPTPTPMIMRVNDTGRYNPIFDFPADTVIPIDAAGAGALLVHRSVFETIREASNNSPLAGHEAGRWCWFKDMPVGGDWVGEDIFFCRRVRDMGFPIHAATGAVLAHHKEYWLSAQQYVIPKEATVTEPSKAELEARKKARDPKVESKVMRPENPAAERAVPSNAGVSRRGR